MSRCVFCRILNGEEPAHVVAMWPDAWAIVPLNPVVDGHRLIIPIAHIDDAAADPLVAGMAAVRAAELAAVDERPFNLITSAGIEATQTIRHLHWHLVPRRADDGLTLPWTGQVKADG